MFKPALLRLFVPNYRRVFVFLVKRQVTGSTPAIGSVRARSPPMSGLCLTRGWRWESPAAIATDRCHQVGTGFGKFGSGPLSHIPGKPGAQALSSRGSPDSRADRYAGSTGRPPFRSRKVWTALSVRDVVVVAVTQLNPPSPDRARASRLRWPYRRAPSSAFRRLGSAVSRRPWALWASPSTISA